MIKLTKATIHKYKSYNSEQTIQIENDITTLVGKNESGKTGFLEAISKINYFQSDQKHELDITADYPRKFLSKFKKSSEDESAVTCDFKISEELINKINSKIGEGVFSASSFSYSLNYKESNTVSGVYANQEKYLKYLYSKFELNKELIEELKGCKTIDSFLELTEFENDGDNNIPTIKSEIKTEIVSKASGNWDNTLSSFVYNEFLKPNMPKFWYFDEYYTLPSRINLNHLKARNFNGDLNEETYKTSMALLELANIDLDELLSSTSFESFLAELEATSNSITDDIFEYWTTNENLEIKFEIETLPTNEKVLDIRIRNLKHRVTLPLQNRSKGFNWFFSFIVWFSKIQSDSDKNFILLLDEPGLNLHASAQEDLLRFIEDLSSNYQVLYTTHSPFMIDSTNLQRVRTILDTADGTQISDVIQEKDSDTLFPLQAALGYNIAQNLFISKNNLLVEGPADLVFLTAMSNLLESKDKTSLNDKFTIVPTGGLDKVASFISLMRGNNLNTVCLLDSFNSKNKQRVDDLISSKIIKDKNVRFFDEFCDLEKADIEDMFSKEEYIKLFNAAFSEYEVKTEDLFEENNQILPQINKIIGKRSFNHYKPANKLTQIDISNGYFSEETLDRFEKMFKEINKLI